MADKTRKYPNNVPGRYYVDEECIFCNLCAQLAPSNFGIDDDGGHDYVMKQPETLDEEEQCKEAKDACPVEAIGNDGK